MSIGRVGKQAQQAAQQYQRRYQINYGPSELGADLQPPRRSRPVSSETAPETAAETVQRAPLESPIEYSTPEESVVMPEMVQRVEDENSGDEGATNSDHPISPKDVAERVYALFLRDIKREQERLGTFRKAR